MEKKGYIVKEEDKLTFTGKQLKEWKRLIKEESKLGFIKFIEDFNFGYDYNRDCMIKERLLEELKKAVEK